MKKSGFSHIRKWLWMYVFLVVISTLASYILIYDQMIDSLASHVLTYGFNTADRPITSNPSVSGAKLRILLLLTGSLLTIVLFSFVWLRIAMRQINRPIRMIHRAVSRLAQGKLNETVMIENSGEFGQIGSGINELAANLQELLLYIWKQTGQCITTLEQLRELPDIMDQESLGRKLTDEHLQELTHAIENLREMAKAYVFYDVHLEGERTMAIKQPGRKEAIDSPSG